jgi:hypothetical protein
MRKPLKIIQKCTQKTLQNPLFLDIPKLVLISGPDQLAQAKIIRKRPKNLCIKGVRGLLWPEVAVL